MQLKSDRHRCGNAIQNRLYYELKLNTDLIGRPELPNVKWNKFIIDFYFRAWFFNAFPFLANEWGAVNRVGTNKSTKAKKTLKKKQFQNRQNFIIAQPTDWKSYCFVLSRNAMMRPARLQWDATWILLAFRRAVNVTRSHKNIFKLNSCRRGNDWSHAARHKFSNKAMEI